MEPVAFTKVSALGIEEQRVNMIVSLDGGAATTLGLGDGFRADARIVTLAQDNALLAPSAALMRDGSGWRVFVIDMVARPARVLSRSETATRTRSEYKTA